MPKPANDSISPDEVRRHVDEIMARWQSFPGFAALLDTSMRCRARHSLSQIVGQPEVIRLEGAGYMFLDDPRKTSAYFLNTFLARTQKLGQSTDEVGYRIIQL